MSSLLVTLETETPFDTELLERILIEWPGMARIDDPGDRAFYRYPSPVGGFEQLWLQDDNNALVVEDTSLLAYEFCIWLQARYPDGLTVFDDCYSFHLKLKDFATVDKLVAAASAGQSIS